MELKLIIQGKELFTITIEDWGTMYDLSSDLIAMLLDKSNWYSNTYIACVVKDSNGNVHIPSSGLFDYKLKLGTNDSYTLCSVTNLSGYDTKCALYDIVDNSLYESCTLALVYKSGTGGIPVTMTFYKVHYEYTESRLKGLGLKVLGNNASKVVSVTYNGLGGNFYAPNSPITAESYASLIENANSINEGLEFIEYISKSLGASYYIDTEILEVSSIHIKWYCGDQVSSGTSMIFQDCSDSQHVCRLDVGWNLPSWSSSQANKGTTYDETKTVSYGSYTPSNTLIVTCNIKDSKIYELNINGIEFKPCKYNGVEGLYNVNTRRFHTWGTTRGNSISVINKDITISSDSAKLISEYCTYNPTTKTANTLISDANTKGFDVSMYADADISSIVYEHLTGFYQYNIVCSDIPINRARKIQVNYPVTERSVLITIYLEDGTDASSSWVVGGSNVLYSDKDIVKLKIQYSSQGYVDWTDKQEEYFKNEVTVSSYQPYTLLPSLSISKQQILQFSDIYAANGDTLSIDFIKYRTAITFETSDTAPFIAIYYHDDLNGWDPRYGNYQYITNIKHSSNVRTLAKLDNSSFVINGTTIKTFSTTSFSITDYYRIRNSIMQVFKATINDNLFIPANNGTTDGLLNLSTLVFYPLTSV